MTLVLCFLAIISWSGCFFIFLSKLVVILDIVFTDWRLSVLLVAFKFFELFSFINFFCSFIRVLVVNFPILSDLLSLGLVIFYFPFNELFYDDLKEFKPLFRFSSFNWLTKFDGLLDRSDYLALRPSEWVKSLV